MLCLRNELLEIDIPVAKAVSAQTNDLFKGFAKLNIGPAHAHTDASSACRAFEDNRITKSFGARQRIQAIGENSGPGEHWNSASPRDFTGCMLQREGLHLFNPWPDEGNAALLTLFRELHVFAKKAITGMNGLRPRFFCRREYAIR